MLDYFQTSGSWSLDMVNLSKSHNGPENGLQSHSALLEKYSVTLKSLLQQGISDPEFYGDLVYRFRKIVGKSNFSEQFRKLINRYKRIGCSLDIMRQTACLVVNQIIVDGYASWFSFTLAYSRISHEYSSLFIIVINLIFMFSL